MQHDFLHKKLEDRKRQNALRSLRLPAQQVDFCSNDYLGIVKNNLLVFHQDGLKHGSTGSRLLAGNYALIEETEKFISGFHDAEAGLIFNSGYDANVGLLASVPQKGDLVIYDQLIHASIRDGIRLGFAQAFSFLHNDAADLEIKLKKNQGSPGNVFVITESVYSMDGDIAPLEIISNLCQKYGAHLVVDEAHATGIIGEKGAGVIQQLNLQDKCFARVHTFGKACGAHGAIVLGSAELRNYLVNFARPFIYSTALPEISTMAIKTAYTIFPGLSGEREILKKLVVQFQDKTKNKLPADRTIQYSCTPIQVVVIPGNENVKQVAEKCISNNLDVRAILYPTVPKEKERLRIVLHAFNTDIEVERLLGILRQ